MSSPAKLRSVFGSNLRKLAAQYPSVAGLCRELAVNRTQFNRYLSGESFPRPDVLHRICVFFDVDARILLEPVEKLKRDHLNLFQHPQVRDYLSAAQRFIPEKSFPSGFYSFSRRSFVSPDMFVYGLVYIYRADGHTIMRGYEPPAAMSIQGMSIAAQQREFRGAVISQESGITILAARRGATTCSFSYLSGVSSFKDNYWQGYATRTVDESLSEERVARLVYEHLGHDLPAALAVARCGGFVSKDDLPPFHARLLRVDQPFR